MSEPMNEVIKQNEVDNFDIIKLTSHIYIITITINILSNGHMYDEWVYKFMGSFF